MSLDLGVLYYLLTVEALHTKSAWTINSEVLFECRLEILNSAPYQMLVASSALEFHFAVAAGFVRFAVV